MAKIKEVDLAEAVIAWLEEQHWDVYQEVQIYAYSGIADIVAVKDFIVWVIECKTSLTWNVIEQANGWRSHFRSIAVPKSMSRTAGRFTAYRVCHQFFKLGVIEVTPSFYKDAKWTVDEVKPAPLMREFHKLAKRFTDILVEEHKTHAKAGSVRSSHFTPYRSTMNAVKKFITENPGCTLKEIMAEDGKWHYASYKSARGSIRKALFDIESGWCRVDTDSKPWRYYLREDDNHALG